MESRVQNALYPPLEQCLICMDPIKPVSTLHSEDHPLIGMTDVRSDSCGHLIHFKCAVDLSNHRGNLVDTFVEDGLFVVDVVVNCPLCDTIWKRFESAELSLGRFHS